MNHIEELMKTAGVSEYPSEILFEGEDIYPNFTAGKQIEIENLILKEIGYLRIDYTKEIPTKIEERYQYNVFGGSFGIHSKNYTGKTRKQALAQLTTGLMKAGELDKEKVKEILGK